MPLISKVAKVTLLFQYYGSDSADVYVVTSGCTLLLIRAFSVPKLKMRILFAKPAYRPCLGIVNRGDLL